MGMVERATLVVLAEAAEIGLPEATAVPAAAFDPFLRGAIRRRASEAVARAEERTSVRAGDHVLRVAFLLVHAGAPKDFDANDERAVCEVFDRLSLPLVPHLEKPKERRAMAYRETAADRVEAPATIEAARVRKRPFWPVTTPLVGAVIAATLAAVVVTAIPYWIPDDAARFRKTPFGRALDEPLTDVVTGTRPPVGGGRAALLADDVAHQIGPAARVELDRLLGTLPDAAASAGGVDAAMAPVFAAINGLDGRLREANVPAFLHAYAYGNPESYSVWVTSYYVAHRAEIVFDGTTTSTVWGRRLDGLNLADSGIYKAKAEDAAVVSLDVIDRSFVETFLPALARDAGPSDPSATPRMALEHDASRIVARELSAAGRTATADAEALAGAIARRNLAMERYGREGQPVIELSPTMRKAIAAPGGSEEAVRLDAQMHMHRRKVAPAIDVVTRLAEEAFVVRLHDEERFATTVFPRLGAADFSAITRARVSSDLGTVARASCPHVALWLVVRKVLVNGAERTSAEAVVRLLAKELGAPLEPGRVGEEALARAVRPALDLDAEKLRAIAAKAYEEAFTTPVPALVRRDF